ncbi:response regulator transcription factor [Dehalobacter sp. DCM]|uniref:response regulator transcription factor n=1 Tax=Dehalobacter sp. DCM TaxID=2907827 RepID=UPI00308171BF|nr:response regulator transcription factor [Dehalobacter sp. DCM]
MARILIVEDEVNIAELVKYNLIKSGYSADYEVNGNTAYERILAEKPDAVILDRMLPEMDGLEICRLLRQNEDTRLLPIIMITARSEEIDRIVGLEVGADDYVTKPFSVKELVARVKAHLRRTTWIEQESAQENKLIRGGLTIYPEKYEAKLGEKMLDLTTKEFQLLYLLAQNEGKCITRERILDSIWGYQYHGDTRTVDVHIRHLRQKIELEPATIAIETMRGVGYRFKSRYAR